ncbi:MAG TPA: RuBisCO large subunit C-terminal-like domain-containing protein [Candidatus Baltobacteraceae bacterium]|nr:RuBisCO large subunit C-terminal-like domain-containing protein [Candidatus Baltobacteraceae bacterium]
MERLTATYLVETAAARIDERAAAIALEQSVECPLDAVHDARVREEVVGRVGPIERVDERRWRVEIELAMETTGYEPAQLVNMISGNSSLWDDVRLVDVDLPPALLAAFRGPRHGVAGLRALAAAPARALTAVAVKPQGLPVRELARLCGVFAEAGIDVVKDDHGISDQSYSPYPERVRACQAAVADASRATGRASFYAPNVAAAPRAMRERVRIAREEGVRVVLVAPMLVGLPAFADLVDEFPDMVYLAHPSFAGAARIANPLLFGKLFRLFGADASIFVNYGGRFAYPQDECAAIASASRASWGALAPTMPVPAGGMRLERVEELLDFYGADTMLLIGGNLLIAEGDALRERARAFVEAVERCGDQSSRVATNAASSERLRSPSFP